MKKIYYLLYFLIFFFLVFLVIAFQSNIKPFAQQHKKYLAEFSNIRNSFNQEINQTEENIYEKFLNNKLNRNLIDNIIVNRANLQNTNFSFPPGLVNFTIIDSGKETIYQVHSQDWLKPLIENMDFKMKTLIGESSNLLFQIPYEKNLKKYILFIELNSLNLLKKSINHLSEYNQENLIFLPEILIVDADKIPRELSENEKTEIKIELKKCNTYKKICYIYLPFQQKNLIADIKSYNDLSIGFLYSSNPLDLSEESIIIFIELLALITLTSNIILIAKIQSKKSKKSDQGLNSSSFDPFNTIDNSSKNNFENSAAFQEGKGDDEIDPSDIDKIPGLRSKKSLPGLTPIKQEENVESNDLPQIDEEFYNKRIEDSFSEVDETNTRHHEKDLPVTDSENNRETSKDTFSDNSNEIPQIDEEIYDKTREDLSFETGSENNEETSEDTFSDNSDEVPQIDEEIYDKTQGNLSSKNNEISALHQEINQPVTTHDEDGENLEDNALNQDQPELPIPSSDPTEKNIETETTSPDQTKPSSTINTKSESSASSTELKKTYKEFASLLIKKFFPKQNLKEAEKLLLEFPHADSLLLLEHKDNAYQCQQSLFSDPETIKNCRIEENHYFINDFMSLKKGVIILKGDENISTIKPWFSEEAFAKLESIFMFPISFRNHLYIFILY